jgi:inosine-uridine nucleoside N-ribohydrolase
VNAAFATTLATDHAAAGADVANELPLRGGLTEADDFWDPLAAVILADEGVATIETLAVEVVTDAGADSGRTRRSDAGTPIRAATGADQAALEAAFLAGLPPLRGRFGRPGRRDAGRADRGALTAAAALPL